MASRVLKARELMMKAVVKKRKLIIELVVGDDGGEREAESETGCGREDTAGDVGSEEKT